MEYTIDKDLFEAYAKRVFLGSGWDITPHYKNKTNITFRYMKKKLFADRDNNIPYFSFVIIHNEEQGAYKFFKFVVFMCDTIDLKLFTEQWSNEVSDGLIQLEDLLDNIISLSNALITLKAITLDFMEENHIIEEGEI